MSDTVVFCKCCQSPLTGTRRGLAVQNFHNLHVKVEKPKFARGPKLFGRLFGASLSVRLVHFLKKAFVPFAINVPANMTKKPSSEGKRKTTTKCRLSKYKYLPMLHGMRNVTCLDQMLNDNGSLAVNLVAG